MIKSFFKETVEVVSRLGRQSISENDLRDDLFAKLQKLRTNGYVTFDHLVGTDLFAKSKKHVNYQIENELAFQTPCLAQSHIEHGRDVDLIKRNFKASEFELAARNLLFERNQVSSYEQVIEDFAPSTLTLNLPQHSDIFDLWLDADVTAVIEAYMGFTPILREAYVRRNFPCKYPVMNHKWHRDSNHRKHLLKAFIFFTDCDVDTGAHQYIAGSVNDDQFREERYFEDAEIDEAYPDASGRRIISEVKAGTIMLEDTRGLHKAGIPKHSFRDLGYAVFLPGSIMHRSKALYDVKPEILKGLSAMQRRYIPTRAFCRK
jgi:hypothetical protein